MNRVLLHKLVCTGTVIATVLGCSQSGPNSSGPNGSGGETSTPGGGANTGGVVNPGGGDNGTGGEQSGGGNTSQPDTSNNNTGGASSPGDTSTGGVGNTGGNGPTGGTKAGGGASANGGNGTVSTGGSRAGGGTSATGGSGNNATGGTTTASTSGTKATGGAATGGSKATGGAATGGASAATGGSTSISIADIVPDLAKGFYWEGTCSGSIAVTGHNCPMADSCPSNGIDRQVTQTVGGSSSQTYTVTIEVRGVIGTRCYKNGTRASTAAPSETGTNNWWYIGGVYDNPTGWWNSYELHVAPTTGDASGDVYYFNGSDVGGGTYCEREASYLVKYTASFKVKGGGTLTFKIHDQNCKAQQNCGSNTDPNSTCAPRIVDLSGMTPQPDATFKQAPTDNVAGTTYYPQWMWITATKVTSP